MIDLYVEGAVFTFAAILLLYFVYFNEAPTQPDTLFLTAILTIVWPFTLMLGFLVCLIFLYEYVVSMWHGRNSE